MAALTTMLLVGGLALGAAGAVMQYQGQKQAQAGQQEALNLQQQNYQKQQAIQEQQMNLDAERRTRQIVRAQASARATALAATTASGAQFGSGLAGAYGGISGQGNENLLGLNQNRELGTQAFASNIATSNGMIGAYRSMAAGSGMGLLGGAMTSLGGMVLNNEGVINRVGTYFSSGSSFNPSRSSGAIY